MEGFFCHTSRTPPCGADSREAMSYRTRKYILRLLSWILAFTGIAALYVLGAHKHRLPAVFEYYTGEPVRTYTAQYFDSTKQTELRVQGSTPFSVTSALLLDREYFNHRETQTLLEEQFAHLHRSPAAQEVIYRITSSPALLGYLQNPASRFAPLFKSEWQQETEQLSYVRSLTIFDQTGKVLLQHGTLPPKKANDDFEDSNGFQRTISLDSSQYSIAAEWNLSSLLLQNIVSHETAFAVLKQNSVLAVSRGAQRFPEIQTGKPFQGLPPGYRSIRTPIGDMTLVQIFERPSLFWYFFRVVALGFFVFLITMIFVNIRKVSLPQLRPNQRPWSEEILEEAISLEQKTLHFSAETQKVMRDYKLRENETMESFTRAVTGIRFFLEESIARKEAETIPQIRVQEDAEPAALSVSHEAKEIKTETVQETTEGSDRASLERFPMPILLESGAPEDVEEFIDYPPQKKNDSGTGFEEKFLKFRKKPVETEIEDETMTNVAHHRGHLLKSDSFEEIQTVLSEEPELLALGMLPQKVQFVTAEKKTLDDFVFIDSDVDRQFSIYSISEKEDKDGNEPELQQLGWGDPAHPPLFLEEDLLETDICLSTAPQTV